MKIVSTNECLLVKAVTKNNYVRQNIIPARLQSSSSKKRKEDLCRNIAKSFSELSPSIPAAQIPIIIIGNKKYQRRERKKPAA